MKSLYIGINGEAIINKKYNLNRLCLFRGTHRKERHPKVDSQKMSSFQDNFKRDE